MDTVFERFKKYLQTQKHPASSLTIKNYIVDIKKFIHWWEQQFGKQFDPTAVTPQIIDLFKNSKALPSSLRGSETTEAISSKVDRHGRLGDLAMTKNENQCVSPRSVERYMSSLRKFFNFLKLEGLLHVNPFYEEQRRIEINKSAHDPFHIKNFKNYLYVYNAAHLTIKNYVMDVKQFLNWAEEVTGIKDAWQVKDKDLFSKIDSFLVEEYKNRLINGGMSPLSINRKLSSIRRYMKWAESEGLIRNLSNMESIKSITGLALQKSTLQIQSSLRSDSAGEAISSKVDRHGRLGDLAMTETNYSKIPPLRLVQKVSKGLNLLLEGVIVNPIVNTIEGVNRIIWRARGRKIFHPLHVIARSRSDAAIFKRIASPFHGLAMTGKRARNDDRRPRISNIPKSVYAPLSVSTINFPWHKKLLFHAKHTRPNWYKRYNSYPITQYFRLAIFVILLSGIAFAFYQKFIFEPNQGKKILAALVSPPRIMSFQRRLTDNNDNPITTGKSIRFTIYNDPSASGSALKWQELQYVTPDSDGIFSVLLGSDQTVAQSLFAENSALYLGVTIERDSELIPRQQLATVAYATNAEVLQGMPPITDSGQTTNTNTTLALNSNGTLAIGGVAITTFQATSAEFKLTGQPLTLTTNYGSNANVTITTDGLGKIDLQKPLQNTSNNNNISSAIGSVEIDDLLSVLATSSGQSAFTINQTGSGPIISASASGIAKFTISNSGNAYFAGNVGIANANPAAALDISGGLTMTGYATISSSLVVGYSNVTGGVGNGVFSGNVGIGTTNPSQRLEVANGSLKMTSGNIILNNNWLSGDGGNEGVFVKSDGNVGIGTTDPASKLQVAGDITPEATGTRNLGSASLYWSNLYVNSIIGASTGIQGYFQRNSQALSPTNITDDLLLGATSTTSALIKLTGTSGGDSWISTGNVGIGGTYPGTAKLYVNGNVGIGTTLPGYKLDVAGDINTTGDVRKNGTAYNNPDYVFEPTYDLMSLEDLKQFTLENKHLPGIPSSEDIKRNGVALFEQTRLNLEKLEEAYLYIFDLNEKIISLEKKLLSRVGTFSEAVIITLKTEFINAADISTNSLSIATANITIAGQSLRDYIAQVVNEVLEGDSLQSKESPLLKIVSPVGEIDRINTNLISPLASGSAIVVNGKLVIKPESLLPDKTSSDGGRMDSSEVVALEVQGNASISGTLHAKKIVANEIEGLDEKLATLSATNVTNITNIYNIATPSATPSSVIPAPSSVIPAEAGIQETWIPNQVGDDNTRIASSPAELDPRNDDTLDTSIDLASYSAQLTYVENFNAEFGKFNQGLIALGPASFLNVSVTDQLSVGGNLILAYGSVNVLGSDLELQPLRQGGIAMMGGLFHIDTSGNIKAGGNAEFAKDVNIKGILSANIIAPIPDKDLVIKLGGSPSSQVAPRSFSEVGTPGTVGRLVIENASGSSVMSIDSEGNVIASGTATIKDIFAKTFNVVRGAQADTSFTETVATASAGTATIIAGEMERTIISPYITEDSLIYITPTSNTQGITPYVARQTPSDGADATPDQAEKMGSFTIQIPQRAYSDIKVNWWIIN